ncbi:MAG: response regulator transcription factor [Solirubrobacteraceae bacterium]
MFEGDASRAVEAVRGVDPAAVLVLITRLDEPLLKALAHERVSCISAYSEVPAIVSAIRALLSGKVLLPPDVQSALMDVLRKPSPPQSLWLTSREEQVLELAATGLTISQIATSLHISHSTAKSHLLRIYEKLEAPNRSAAVANAVARGMLRLSTEADERIKTAPSQTFDGLNAVDALAKL